MRHATSGWLATLLFAAGAVTTGCLNENLIKQPELTIIPGAPAGWGGTANTSGIGTTVSERHSGSTSAYLSSAFEVGISGNYQLVQAIRANDYRGKRVRLSAWLKPRNVLNAAFSGIWMRIDGPGFTLASDNMANRVVSGYGDWRQVSVVLDVAASAIGISFGAQFQANNTLLVDDMRFEVVESTVASTNQLAAPIADARDSATIATAYSLKPSIPVNLDFEGLPAGGSGTASQTLQWPATVATSVRNSRTQHTGNAEYVLGSERTAFAYHLKRVSTRRRLYVNPHHSHHESVPGAGGSGLYRTDAQHDERPLFRVQRVASGDLDSGR